MERFPTMLRCFSAFPTMLRCFSGNKTLRFSASPPTAELTASPRPLGEPPHRTQGAGSAMAAGFRDLGLPRNWQVESAPNGGYPICSSPFDENS
jgi:hypothetical protein